MLAIFHIPFRGKKKKRILLLMNCTVNTTMCTARTVHGHRLVQKSPSTLPEKSVITGSLLKDN